jgi:peptide/nickel transport system substrate-binding protein
LAQLQTHEIDVYDSVAENQIGRLGSIPGIAVAKRLLANERHLTINTARPQLSDVRVRLAIAEAVDWDRINAQIYHGYNVRARSDILPTSWAAPQIPFYPHDPAGARKLLDAAGWSMGPDGYRHRQGEKLVMQISTGTNKQANEQAEIQIQGQLKSAGIQVVIRNYPVNLLFARDGPLYSGKYDTSWTIDTYGPDPDNQGNWSGKFIPPNGANTSWIDDPVINETSAAQVRTFDRAVRKALIQREEMRIHELVPAVFLYWENAYAAYNDDLKNFKPAQYIANAWNSWEWEI